MKPQDRSGNTEENTLGLFQKERTCLFIDGVNLYSSARALEFDIDYRKMLNLFRSRTKLLRAYYYTALVEDDNFSPIRPLIDWLDYNGFTMVTKTAKVYHDQFSDKRRIKGNMDMDLAIDMLEMCPYMDHVILFSGDGDFKKLCEVVQKKGLRLSVVSTVQTTPQMIADELRRQADNFIDLADIIPLIDRDEVPARDRGDSDSDGDTKIRESRDTREKNYYERKNNTYNNRGVTTIHGEDDFS